MRDGVGGVDGHGDARVPQVGGPGVLLAALDLIQDVLDPHAQVVRLLQLLRDGRGGERVGLHQDRGLGHADGLHDSVLGAAVEGEVDLRRGVLQDEVGREAGDGQKGDREKDARVDGSGVQTDHQRT